MQSYRIISDFSGLTGDKSFASPQTGAKPDHLNDRQAIATQGSRPRGGRGHTESNCFALQEETPPCGNEARRHLKGLLRLAGELAVEPEGFDTNKSKLQKNGHQQKQTLSIRTRERESPSRSATTPLSEKIRIGEKPARSHRLPIPISLVKHAR